MVLLYFSVSLPRTAAPVIDLDDETFRYPSPTGRRHGCHRAVAAHGPGDRHHGRGRRAPRLKSEAALQRAMKAPFRSRSRSGCCCSWRYRPSRPRSGSSNSRPRWPATSRERHFPTGHPAGPAARVRQRGRGAVGKTRAWDGLIYASLPGGGPMRQAVTGLTRPSSRERIRARQPAGGRVVSGRRTSRTGSLKTEAASQMAHPRSRDRQRAATRIPLRWIGALQAQVKRALPATSRCCAEAFKISRSASSWADPMCSMSRDPRWQDSAICTAAVPAVRTDVHTGPLYGPGLVHKSSRHDSQTCRSATRMCFAPPSVS